MRHPAPPITTFLRFFSTPPQAYNRGLCSSHTASCAGSGSVAATPSLLQLTTPAPFLPLTPLGLFHPSPVLFPTMEYSEKAAGSRKNMAVGPWGGNGGSPWDDGSYSGVREIKLVYGSCIDSIQVLYDKNGKPFQAEKHGSNGGHHTALVKLKYPEEFLTAVSGHYGAIVHGGGAVIRSLTLKTNQRSIGPFGVQEGTPFSFPIEGGFIVGFKGRSGWYLDAIGFRLSYPRSSSLLGRVLQRLGTLATKQLSYKNGDQPKSPAPKAAKAAV